MSPSIKGIIERLKKDKKLKSFNLQRKIKPHNSELLKEMGKDRLSRKEAIEAVAKIAVRKKSKSGLDKELKKRLGLNVSQRKEVLKSLQGREMTAKDLIAKGIPRDVAEKIYDLSGGKILSTKEIKKMERKIEMRRKLNVFQSNRAREEEELQSRRSADKIKSSAEAETSARLNIAGVEYKAGGIQSSTVSSQEFRKKSVGVSSNSSTVSAMGSKQSGGVLNQGKNAKSVAGGFGVKNFSGSNFSASPKGSKPLGF